MVSKLNEYDDWHEVVHGKEDPNIIILQDWHKNALSLSLPLKNLNVLEIGCGVGDFAIYLANQGANVTAVDFSSKAIRIAKEKSQNQGVIVNFQVADAQALPFEDNSFDLIFSCECLEHVPEPQLALNEMSKVLKPFGKLILTTENYSNAILLLWLVCWLRKQPFNSGEKVQPIEHLFLYWNVKHMFNKAGLQVQDMTGTHHVFLLLPRFHPHTFVVEKFRNPLLARLFRPLARHMTFVANKAV
jgi:ubiquinone biosynthesis O-methyltransferase